MTEVQGSVCVNVVRDANDSDVFRYRAVSIGNLDAGRTALGRCRYHVHATISRNAEYSHLEVIGADYSIYR